jgi:hypothetical protein
LPPWQVEPALQPLPQVPQFRSSVSTLVHAPLQSVSPAGHVVVQTPLAQAWPAAQTVPQAPQLALSVPVFVHACPQSVSPAEHVATQSPFEQA